MAATSQYSLCCIPGITLRTAIDAAPKTPHFTFLWLTRFTNLSGSDPSASFRAIVINHISGVVGQQERILTQLQNIAGPSAHHTALDKSGNKVLHLPVTIHSPINTDQAIAAIQFFVARPVQRDEEVILQDRRRGVLPKIIQS